MIATDKPDNYPDQAAKILAVIFHPLLMPVYGLIIIFSAPTLLEYLSFNIKKLLLLLILINNILLPLSFFPFLIHRKIVTSWNLRERKERNIPLIITTFLYCATSFIIFRLPVPVFLKSFIFGFAFLSLMATVINFWWKISLYSMSAGAMISLVFMLSLKMLTPLEWYLISAVIVAGLILSSRLRLNLHSPRQVWVGLLAGFIGLSLFMEFFQQLI
jgi:hypothetical protein